MKLVYKKGSVEFYLGDAKNLDLIQDESIDFICTSPPYYNAREEYSVYTDYQNYLTLMHYATKEMWRVLRKDGRIAINVPMGYGRDPYIPIGTDWTNLLVDRHFGLRGHIIWVKGETNGSTAWGSWLSPSNPSLRDSHEIIIVASKLDMVRKTHLKESTIDKETFLSATSSVWNIQPSNHKWHPAVFPPEIPRRLIELYTYKNDTVLDPFAGSGTTVWMAEKLGRKAIGIELKEEYAKMAVGPLFYKGKQTETSQGEN